jgi:hypothetical protein
MKPAFPKNNAARFPSFLLLKQYMEKNTTTEKRLYPKPKNLAIPTKKNAHAKRYRVQKEKKMVNCN